MSRVGENRSHLTPGIAQATYSSNFMAKVLKIKKIMTDWLRLWYDDVCLGYLNVRKCRNKQSPFIYDLNHNPIYVDDFCRQTGLRRTTWRESIRVEKDGEIVSALPLLAPTPGHTANAARRAAAQAARQAQQALLDAEWAARHAAAQAARPAAARAAASRSSELVALEELAAAPAPGGGGDMCVVCHEMLRGGQRLAATSCGHVFCVGCISRSLGHRDQCPTCRKAKPAVIPLYF